MPDLVTDDPVTARSRDRAWPFWPVVPLYPYGQRQTLRREIVPGAVWVFEQLQGILYVAVPVRMTVVKLAMGGLLVYAPVAPTRECIRLLRELEQAHGTVQHIILPTTTGIEHKVFVGPFARQCPEATVWVAPDQWSFPLNLPLSWLGLPRRRTRCLPHSASETPFAHQIDYAIVGPIQLGLGPFVEVAMFDRRSQTLLLTDTLVAVPEDPPEIVQQDPYPLLFHARDRASDRPLDTPANRRRGWQRIALFAFYFRPSALEPVPWGEAWQEAQTAGDRSRRAYFGLYPFRWKPDWQASFTALRQGGQPFVAPVLQSLILNRGTTATLNWVNTITLWPFERVIPCHLDAPLAIGAQEVRQAFAFLIDPASSHDGWGDRRQADFQFLRELETTLKDRRVLPPSN